VSDSAEIELSEEQRGVCASIADGHSVFVTGRAGTGKSTILRHLMAALPGKVAVCAPTGVAALNVGGQTLHSLFGLGIGVQDAPRAARRMRSDVAEVLGGIDTLIIDEVSMVSADVLDAVDRCLRQAKHRRTPFGGVQLVLFGDPYQLSPVPPRSADERTFYRDRYRSQWFFDAKVWEEQAISVAELTQVHRQHDDGFKQLLNAVREGHVPPSWIARLNEIGHRKPPEDGIITLATTNRSVDERNRAALAELRGRTRVLSAEVEGEFGHSFPADPELELKTDAQVMLLRNDPDGRWVNGSIGRVRGFGDGEVQVEIDGSVETVTPITWEQYQYTFDPSEHTIDREEVGEFRQFPLRLAWAATIHKSQGQTFERAVIDLGARAFSPGQTYVALSRLTSLEGLYLARPVRSRDILVDARVAEFLQEAPTALF
jgi:ATP-dependent exoDNAse (exonuclease V) alpha subunit